MKYLYNFVAAGWTLLALGILPFPLGIIIIGFRNRDKAWSNVMHICTLFKYNFNIQIYASKIMTYRFLFLDVQAERRLGSERPKEIQRMEGF